MQSGAFVFVYGSLRLHEGNHLMLGDSELVARQCSTEGRLYDTGFGYPAMVQARGARVYGELYRVTPIILSRLDALEGYYGEGESNDYERVSVTISTDTGSESAFVYVYSEQQTFSMTPIPDGDWRLHQRTSGR